MKYNKNSGLRVILMFTILPGFLGFAQGFKISQLQWASGATVKLQHGEVFAIKIILLKDAERNHTISALIVKHSDERNVGRQQNIALGCGYSCWRGLRLSLFCKTAGGEERRHRIPADQKIVLTKQTTISGIEPKRAITAFNVTVTAENAGNTL